MRKILAVLHGLATQVCTATAQEGTLVLSESDGGLNGWLLVRGPEKEKNNFRPSWNVMSPPFPLSRTVQNPHIIA